MLWIWIYGAQLIVTSSRCVIVYNCSKKWRHVPKESCQKLIKTWSRGFIWNHQRYRGHVRRSIGIKDPSPRCTHAAYVTYWRQHKRPWTFLHLFVNEASIAKPKLRLFVVVVFFKFFKFSFGRCLRFFYGNMSPDQTGFRQTLGFKVYNWKSW